MEFKTVVLFCSSKDERGLVVKPMESFSLYSEFISERVNGFFALIEVLFLMLFFYF